MGEDFSLRAEMLVVFPIVFGIESARYLITAGLCSLVIWAFWRAWFHARKLQTRAASAADYRREILASLRTTVMFAVTGFGMHLAGNAGHLTIYEDLTVRGPLYFGVTVAAMIIAHDAWFYWTHRAMHHPRLFRHFHATHHKSRTPTPWAAYSFDVPEAFLMVAFVPLWVAIVPMHDLGIFAFMTFQITRNVMGHAGVELSPASGRPSRLFGWLNTTTHHDLHHQDARVNFGLYFSWWDRMMGTEHPDYQARVAEVVGRPQERRPRKAAVAESVLVGPLLVVMVAAAALTGSRAEAQAHPEAGVESRADSLDGIAGRWATRGFGSIVAFAPCTENPETICGKIVWLWEPADAKGRPRTDGDNPDRAFRDRPLIGIEIVSGLRKTGPDEWGDGAVYNPDDGRTYSGKIRLQDGALELRGCALKVFCQTQTWRRPEDIFAAIEEIAK